MWDTRPHRIPKDEGGRAVIAGVCAGIGEELGVDPLLPRLLFALALFWNPAVVVATYLVRKSK